MQDRIAGGLEWLTKLTLFLTLPVGLLTGLFVGLSEGAAVFVIGWLLIVPALSWLESALPFDWPSWGEASDDEESTDPLAELKSRYARGEIDDAEFESRVERLVAADEAPADALADGPTDADGSVEQTEVAGDAVSDG